MTFTTLTTGGFALGLGALALGLYLLQRLRVRHDEVLVVSTLFWREAQEEARARTLVERFRHPLAYLLALLVAGMLWLAAAGPDSRRERGTQHVLLLDASAGMALPGRFEAATAALQRELAASPRDRTEVLWCGAEVHTLLAPGEDRALLAPRLAGRVPEAVPASVERAVVERAAARRVPGDGAARRPAPAVRMVVVGDAPVRALALQHATLAAAADGGELRLERAAPAAPAGSGSTAASGSVGRGITALGVAPAASGEWTRVDLYVAVRGAGAADAEVLATLDGAPVTGAERSVVGPDHVELLLRDVAAEGGTFEVRLAGEDPLVADDAARAVLPDRPRIRVALAAGTAAELGADASTALLAALGADSAVELVEDPAAADVLVGASAGTGELPALAFVPASEQVEAVLVGHAPGLDSHAVLAAALGELGLDRLDAGTLAEELGRELAVGAAPLAGAAPLVEGSAAASGLRRVTLWSELVSGGAPSFLEDRAFPLVVGRAVRWLAAAPSVTPYVAVGLALPRRVGAPAAPAEVAHPARTGASLLDPARYVLGAAGAERQPAAALGADPSLAFAQLAPGAPEGPGGWRPLTWILLLAAALLGAEWLLVQRGRMP